MRREGRKGEKSSPEREGGEGETRFAPSVNIYWVLLGERGGGGACDFWHMMQFPSFFPFPGKVFSLSWRAAGKCHLGEKK